MINERTLRTPTFRSPQGPAIGRFLEYKRALGMLYQGHALHLANFDDFLSERLTPENPVITADLVREWALQWAQKNGNTLEGRLSVVRQFCQFLHIEDPRTFVPPIRFLGTRRMAFTPRILTREEARRFVEAALSFRPGRLSPLRGKIHGAFFATLYLTGLRRGEGLRLTTSDVEFDAGVLRIHRTKFGKDRVVPMARDVSDMLRGIRSAVEDKFGPRWQRAPFFCGPFGGRICDATIRPSFRQLLKQAQIPLVSLGKKLRIHDLRHSFACHRLLRWYESGADVTNKLPLLAVYLGHLGLESTQRYLHLTEELAGEVSRRSAARFGYLIKPLKETLP